MNKPYRIFENAEQFYEALEELEKKANSNTIL